MTCEGNSTDSSTSFFWKRRLIVVRSGPIASPREPKRWHLMHCAFSNTSSPYAGAALLAVGGAQVLDQLLQGPFALCGLHRQGPGRADRDTARGTRPARRPGRLPVVVGLAQLLAGPMLQQRDGLGRPSLRAQAAQDHLPQRLRTLRGDCGTLASAPSTSSTAAPSSTVSD